MPSPRLISGEARAKKYPDTFQIPSKEDRAALQPGQFAKVIYEGGDYGCRVWIKIDKRVKGGYRGTLDNDDPDCTGKKLGAKVTIKDKHIVDWMTVNRLAGWVFPAVVVLVVGGLWIWLAPKKKNADVAGAPWRTPYPSTWNNLRA